MPRKGYSTFPKVSGLKPHHQMDKNHFTYTCWRSLTSLPGCSRCILHPQPIRLWGISICIYIYIYRERERDRERERERETDRERERVRERERERWGMTYDSMKYPFREYKYNDFSRWGCNSNILSLFINVAKGRMNGAPSETRIHSFGFASLAC